MDSSGCEADLERCADKCGVKVNVLCWTFCLGVAGPASAAATCAVNQGCLNNNKINWEEIGRKIDDLIKEH